MQQQGAVEERRKAAARVGQLLPTIDGLSVSRAELRDRVRFESFLLDQIQAELSAGVTLRIPDACDHFNLSHIRLVRIFELEDWEGH